jgi:hypothetical protein
MSESYPIMIYFDIICNAWLSSISVPNNQSDQIEDINVRYHGDMTIVFEILCGLELVK